jgi:hypothetical protein
MVLPSWSCQGFPWSLFAPDPAADAWKPDGPGLGQRMGKTIRARPERGPRRNQRGLTAKNAESAKIELTLFEFFEFFVVKYPRGNE